MKEYLVDKLKKVLKEKRGNGFVAFLIILAVVAIIGYLVMPPTMDKITAEGESANTNVGDTMDAIEGKKVTP
ncbi:hypothetical protein [Senegalia massiliensis]|uniref:Uncharacterized protein n=1 Tax=Senegalia massiliensis TaxID=1720316 RepID=A0A845R049_9CLOT|nr:hypothetical protein [Senegalia massiliensis]NBI07584.1 hypothetical protein [Senegalia massiliensis]